MIPPLASHTRKGPERRVYKPQFRQKRKRSRSPAGPRRLGTATRISTSLFRRLSAFFESTSRPRLKSGKVCRSDTRPGDVRERAARVEGNDSAPTQNATCFGVCALVCDFSRRAECVPTFARESKRGPIVGEVENWDEKRLGIKFMAAVSPDFLSADSGGSQ